MKKIIIASGPVIVHENKVLLDLSGQDDFWKFIGGKVKDLESENLSEVAVRRAKEELGLEVEIIDNKPFIYYINKEGLDVVLVHYLAQVDLDAKITLGEGVREATWIEISKLKDYPLAPNIFPTLKHFGFIS